MPPTTKLLVKTRTVLIRDEGNTNVRSAVGHKLSQPVVHFISEDWGAPAEDRSTHVDRALLLDMETWQQMGEPDTITVSVEAGNKLEDEEEDHGD